MTYLLGLTDDPASWVPEEVRSSGAAWVAPPATAPEDYPRVSWILGPDVPDRARRTQDQSRRA